MKKSQQPTNPKPQSFRVKTTARNQRMEGIITLESCWAIPKTEPCESRIVLLLLLLRGPHKYWGKEQMQGTQILCHVNQSPLSHQLGRSNVKMGPAPRGRALRELPEQLTGTSQLGPDRYSSGSQFPAVLFSESPLGCHLSYHSVKVEGMQAESLPKVTVRIFSSF